MKTIIALALLLGCAPEYEVQHEWESSHARAMTAELQLMDSRGGVTCDAVASPDGWHACYAPGENEGLILRKCGDARTDGRGFDLSDNRVCMDIKRGAIRLDPYKTGAVLWLEFEERP